MTWTCPDCGAVLTSEEAFRKHICQGKTMSKCWNCGGTGKKIQSIGPSVICPVCNGKGKI